MLLERCGGCYFDLDIELNGQAGYNVGRMLAILGYDSAQHNGAVFWERGNLDFHLGWLGVAWLGVAWLAWLGLAWLGVAWRAWLGLAWLLLFIHISRRGYRRVTCSS